MKKIFKKLRIKKVGLGLLIISLIIFGVIINRKSENSFFRSNDSVLISVQGEVEFPGTYLLKKTSRVEDAIRKAGGFTYLANVNKVNYALKLDDGMVLTIPRLNNNGLIDLNNCTVDDFNDIKHHGLNQTNINAIVKYGSESGFSNIEELYQKGFIKENVYNKIKEYLTI